MTTELKIGQLARNVGVNIETIRYYERRHMLGPTSRLPSGYRVYNIDAQRRLRFIRNAQTLGFTFREIENLLHLQVSSNGLCDDVQRKAEVKLKHVEAKVRDLQSLAKALRRLIRSCKSAQPTDPCPILQSLKEDKARIVHPAPDLVLAGRTTS